MSGDGRKDFILATIGNHFSHSITDGAVAHIPASHELNTFLDDGNCSLLAARQELTDGVELIQVYNTIDTSSSSSNDWLILFKLHPSIITPDNLHSNIIISSLLSSPLDTLYHSLQKVFAPLLTKGGSSIEPKLQDLVTQLEVGLGSVLRRQKGVAIDNGAPPTSTNEEETISGIITPFDEYQYWAESANVSNKLSLKERAQFFQEQLEGLVTEYDTLDTKSFPDDILELIEETREVLSNMWQQTSHDPYPEIRMGHLLEVFSYSISHCVQRRLSGLDYWSADWGKFKEIDIKLKEGLMVCKRWAESTEALTTQEWKQYRSTHPWNGGLFISENISLMINRIEEVSDIRTVHEHLSRLLTANERKEFRLSESFTPFTGLHPLQPNPYTEPLWKAAVSQYERCMNPAHIRIAGKIRQTLKSLEAQPHQLLREFTRYKQLIKKPAISKDLITERETLLGQLSAYIKLIREDFTTHYIGSPAHQSSHQLQQGQDAPPTGKNLPEVVNNIVWARQLEAKVSETLSTADSLLGDLTGYQPFQREAIELKDELHEYQRDQFDSWSRQMIAAIDSRSDPINLETSGRLMELSTNDGKLIVQYSDRLVTLLREVRQLAGLGFLVPAKIQHSATTAMKFYKHAVSLKKIAHFHNTIDQEMIESQKPIMIDTAHTFERLIKNHV